MGTQNPNSPDPNPDNPAPSKWAELARQLWALHEEHQTAWADWDDFQIVRYLAKECSQEESQKIEEMAATHPDMKQALIQIREVMDTVEIDETGQIQLRDRENLKDPDVRDEFAETLETYWGLDAETICRNIEEFLQKNDRSSVIQVEPYEQLLAELPDLLHEARCIASFRDWLDQPGRQFLYDTVCKISAPQWDQYLEDQTVPTPFRSQPESVESHLAHCQLCRLSKRFAELQREKKTTGQLPQAKDYLLQWLESILDEPRKGISPNPDVSQTDELPVNLSDTDTGKFSDTSTAKISPTRDRGAYITWLTPAARALASKDRIGQFETELRTVFPDSRITVANVLSEKSPKQAEQILFVVKVQRQESTQQHILKLGSKEIVQRDIKGWQTCEIDKRIKSSILLSVRGQELPQDRYAAIYEAPPDFSRLDPENTTTLETATIQAIHKDNPSVESVCHALSQFYQEMRSCLYQTRVERPSKDTLDFYREKLTEGSHSILDQWDQKAECVALRDEATVLLSSRRNPRLPEQAGFCDPLSYVRWAFNEHVVPPMDLGIAHGNLHGRNILVGLKEDQAVSPVVFDYSALSSSNPLAWDFASLEVDLKSRVLPELASDGEARQALATATSHRLRSWRYGRPTVELGSRTKRADLPPSERIEFAYQFELLLTALLFDQLHQEGSETPSAPSDEETQIGYPALDRALRLFHRIRHEAALTLGPSRGQTLWQDEYLFALTVCGLTKIQHPIDAPQLEWCVVSSGVASANLKDFSRFDNSQSPKRKSQGATIQESKTASRKRAVRGASREPIPEMFSTLRTTRDLGIEIEMDGNPHCFVPIIPRGTPYPTEPNAFRQSCGLTSAPQRTIRIPVFEGNSPVTTFNVCRGIIDFTLSEDVPPNTPIEIVFRIDANGTLNVVMTVGSYQSATHALQIDLHESVSETEPSTRGTNWREEFESLIHVGEHFLQRYYRFLTVHDRDNLTERLQEARQCLRSNDRERSHSVQNSMTMALLDSGIASTLFLAERAQVLAEKDLAAKIGRECVALERAFDVGNQAEIQRATDALRLLISQAFQQRQDEQESPHPGKLTDEDS